MRIEVQKIAISKLQLNNGQIQGLPKNPRFIRDERFEKLVNSLREFPEMLNIRELVVYPITENKFVVVGGNMRLRAMKELKEKEAVCKIVSDCSVEKLREFTIKDNVSFGQDDWDNLANEWDEVELDEWGMELPKEWDADTDIDIADVEEKDKENKSIEKCPNCGFEWEK